MALELTPEQTEKALNFLKSKDASKKCPSCEQNAGWNLETNMFFWPMLSNNDIDFAQGFPTFLVTCKHCFFVKPYSAVKAGVFVNNA